MAACEISRRQSGAPRVVWQAASRIRRGVADGVLDVPVPRSSWISRVPRALVGERPAAADMAQHVRMGLDGKAGEFCPHSTGSPPRRSAG